MADFTIGFTSQPTVANPSGVIYEITFRQFTNEQVMRTYQPQVNFERTLGGANVLSGPANVSKYIWGVSGVTDKAVGLQLDALYQAWNLDRASGIAAAVAVLDETWGNIGTRSAVFTTPPTFSYTSDLYVVASFGLTEV